MALLLFAKIFKNYGRKAIGQNKNGLHLNSWDLIMKLYTKNSKSQSFNWKWVAPDNGVAYN